MATKHPINASFRPSKCCTTKLSLGLSWVVEDTNIGSIARILQRKRDDMLRYGANKVSDRDAHDPDAAWRKLPLSQRLDCPLIQFEVASAAKDRHLPDPPICSYMDRKKTAPG